MKCFHFSEQRFPCICLNKVPIVSVQHFILSRLVQTLSNTLPLSAISIYNNSLRVLECNQSKQLWHSVVCSVAPEDDKLPLMLSCWSTNDFLFCFTITYLNVCMNILIRTLQGSYLLLTYLCFSIKYSLSQGSFEMLL